MGACEDCVKHSDYKTDNLFTWCTNCGNYSIWGALRNTLVAENIRPRDVLFVHDIGCNGNGSDKIEGYGFKGLHGRAVAFASGAAIVNRKVKVITSAGDGAVLSEGIGHLIHAIRSNYNMVFVIHNNSNFALTTGQASPSTKENRKMNSAPDGTTADFLSTMNLILTLKPSFAARGYTGNQKQLESIFKKAIHHKGFAVIEVLQYCPTYNGDFSPKWFNERIYDVNSDPNYSASDIVKAQLVASDLEDKIATGILFTDTWKQEFNARLKNRENITSELVEEVRNYDITNLLAKYI